MSCCDVIAFGLVDTGLLVWVLSQITVVAVVTHLLVSAMRRASPGSRVIVCGLGLFCMSLLPTVTMIRASAWSWGEWLPAHSGEGTNLAATDRSPVGQTDLDQANVTARVGPNAELAWWRQVLLSSSQVLSRPQPAEPAANTIPRSATPSDWLALFVVCGIAFGATRFTIGVYQVQMLRRQVTAISCAELDRELQRCARRLGITKRIAVAVSEQIGTAAIVGWRRPLLLLPTDWGEWSGLERKAIFAHELAHVRRADYLLTSLAQATVAVNFFHPLAHLLIARLRLNQELAADSMAAKLIGGSQQYVETLASLALRRPMARTPGPAKAFFAPRRMLVRRLEMLNQMKPRGSGWSRLSTMLASAAVLATTMMATGLRPISVRAQENAPPTIRTAGESTVEKALAELVPSSMVQGVIEVDVQSIRTHPPLVGLLKRIEQAFPQLPFKLEGVDQLLIMMPVPGERPPLPPPAILVRFLEAQGLPGEAEMNPDPGGRRLDARTIVLWGTAEMRLAIGTTAGDHLFASLLARQQNAPIRAAGKLSGMRERLRLDFGPPGHPASAFAPLWHKVESASLGVEIGDKITVSGRLDSADPQEVAETLLALQILGKNFLHAFTSVRTGDGRQEPMEPLQASGIANATQLLDSMHVSSGQRQVEINAEMEGGADVIVETMLPALRAARTASHRVASANNLKRLMLALHGYALAHGRFPPAVVVNSESGATRSWRVEMLPYLNERRLYNQYRQDESWDSEANQQVLKRMPSVFALPGNEGTSETPYQAVVTAGGGLTPGAEGQGPAFAEFTDGLHNTLVLVETLPTVPWTKPVDVSDVMAARDVSVRPDENGFLVARGDGSVIFIANNIAETVWRALNTRAGGESVDLQP